MRKLLITSALVVASLGFAAGTAAPSGAAVQRGLVNVNLEDVIVQVPVGLAANVCDVDVAVLAQGLVDGPATCTAETDTDAIALQSPNGQSTNQEGLVNLNVEDVRIQVPVAVAANICDVDVAVLSGLLLDGPTTCEAAADSTAGA